MAPTRRRLGGLVAALSTVAIAAPVSTASAETAAPVPIVAPGWGGSIGFPFTGGAVVWQAPTVLGPAVIGPVIITTAPSSFINTNNQVSAGDNVAGGQVAP